MAPSTAIILAGGLGTRLRPLTYTTPKHLLPVQNKVLVEHILDILKKNSVTEVVLSLQYMADKVKAYFGDGKKLGVNISYLVEKEPMGTAGPLILLKRTGKMFAEDFYMVNGDNLFNLNLRKMIAVHHKNKALGTIALTETEDVSRFGVVELQGDRILRFVEKPKPEEAPSHLINSGYYLLSPKVLDYVDETKTFLMMEKDIFPVLAKEGKLFGYPDKGQWFDTGTFEQYEEVKKSWKL